MTISKIPHQEILKHLGITTSSPKLCLPLEQLIDQSLYQMGDLEALPAHILDRVITFLDAKSAYQLKITCIAFRSLVEANLHQSARLMPRFFDLASHQILEQSTSKDKINHAIITENAKRGSCILAFLKANTVHWNDLNFRDWTYRDIAYEHAIRGNYIKAQVSLSYCWKIENQLAAYEIIASSLAREGHYVHAWEIADRTPLFDLGNRRRAYIAIACAHVQRCHWDLALGTVDKMPTELQESALQRIHIEREKQARLANALEHPEQVQDPTEKDNAYYILTVNLAKEGKFQAALTTALSIQNRDTINSAYKEIAAAQAAHGDLEAAFQTVKKIVEWDYLRYEIYALIGQAYAKKGDFIRCLHTVNLIVDDANRAKAYQKVVTALS